MPKIGYGSNKKTRHLMPNGYRRLVVSNVRDMDLLLMCVGGLRVEVEGERLESGLVVGHGGAEEGASSGLGRWTARDGHERGLEQRNGVDLTTTRVEGRGSCRSWVKKGETS